MSPVTMLDDRPADNEPMQKQQVSSDDYSSSRTRDDMTTASRVPGSSIVTVDSEALPPGWERVVDQEHGTYYIDHNTKHTQYERPYEVELTKGAMGFGFTLVEADNSLLIVRSVIPGGPAYLNGSIRPGDFLISAVGVSISGLQHTDIARLFSTFAVGDRVRLTFARSNYVLDDSLVPDEYLFSNGTNGDMAIAVNPSSYQYQAFSQDQHIKGQHNQSAHILVDDEFEFVTVTLKRGDRGFGFTISDSVAGQKVRKIQDHEVCSNLKQADILMSLNGQDITKLTHKQVVDELKRIEPGEDVTLTVKRKRRFRSKTPMAMSSDRARGEFSLDSTPQRNCKTPSLDGMMLQRQAEVYQCEPNPMNLLNPFTIKQNQISHTSYFRNESDYSTYPLNNVGLTNRQHEHQIHSSLPASHNYDQHSYQNHQQVYNYNPMTKEQEHEQPVYCNQQNSYSMNLSHSDNLLQKFDLNNLAPVGVNPESHQVMGVQDPLNSHDVNYQLTSTTDPPLVKPDPFVAANIQNDVAAQVGQYNIHSNDDKLMMMQIQRNQDEPQLGHHNQLQTSDYHHMPIYSNSEILNDSDRFVPPLPIKPTAEQNSYFQIPDINCQNNFYANNGEIALQNLHFDPAARLGPMVSHDHNSFQPMLMMPSAFDQFNFMQSSMRSQTPHDEHDEYEYHHVELTRENKDSNWGIRLIGGAEVDRAISIGSMIFGGVAAKSGKLKSGDEIVSIDRVSVVGATHQHVVDMISARTNRVLLVVRRKTLAEACDIVLTKNMDEGFGFVIISSENCALIGKIIEGSPADRCKQLRVRDCIIAVNGRYITPEMKHPELVNMIKECGSTLRLRIIPVDCYTVKLIKDAHNDSFGFRMRGGSEYDGTPLYIVRVEANGQAHGLLNAGDQILEINNIPTVGMTHSQAATIIKYSDPTVKLKLRRNYETPPSLLVDSPRALQKYDQVTAEMKAVSRSFSGSRDDSNLSGNCNVDKSVVSFASLPTEVDSMVNRNLSERGHQSLVSALADGGGDKRQTIYEHHSLNYLDQNTLYAS